jgi:hypothetical protein
MWGRDVTCGPVGVVDSMDVMDVMDVMEVMEVMDVVALPSDLGPVTRHPVTPPSSAHRHG